MKKSKLFFILFIFMLFTFNLLLIFKIESQKNNNQEYIESLRSFYEDKFVVEQQNENLKLDMNLKLVNIEGDTVLAKNVFLKNRIILKYSEYNCSACVDSEYENLIKLNSLIVDQVCIIAYYERIRDLLFDLNKLKNKGLNHVPIYLMLQDELNIPLDNQGLPFYFQTNPDLKMTNLFIPEKTKPKLSYYYLKSALENI